jgi:oligopeptide transport system ATP-binding protein
VDAVRNRPEDEDLLLSVDGLTTEFPTAAGVLRAVDGVSFFLRRGEVLGLVGESGSGKSVTALSLIQLVPPPGRVVSGTVVLDGLELTTAAPGTMRRIRGKDVGMVFQDPMTALNPVFTVGEQVAETLRTHLGLTRKAASARTLDLLERVGLRRPDETARQYPHQLSGGMRQRVMIAIAISCDPPLIVADEPTTALDVTVQAQIVELLKSLSTDLGTAILLITHDLGLSAGICDRVNVMYAGRIVESGDVDAVFEHASMPYTSGLLDCLPRFEHHRGTPLHTIEGAPPAVIDARDACRFVERCAHARIVCSDHEPALTRRPDAGHFARCWGTESAGWIS